MLKRNIAILMGIHLSCILPAGAEGNSEGSKNKAAEAQARAFLLDKYPKWQIEFVALADAPTHENGKIYVIGGGLFRGGDRKVWTGCANMETPKIKICGYSDVCCFAPHTQP